MTNDFDNVVVLERVATVLALCHNLHRTRLIFKITCVDSAVRAVPESGGVRVVAVNRHEGDEGDLFGRCL